MRTPKSLPPRPSLDSLRKQAKKLARDIAAGDAGAIARARMQLPNVDLPVTQRTAQHVIAREYGYAGWQDLTAEVSKRLGNGLEWATAQARRVIHDNDVERLKPLLAEYPALLSWQGHDWDSKGGLVGIATGAYGDAGDPERERWFTRAACAELLIDAGAVVPPSVCEGLIESRAKGLLQLFHRKGLLPRTLRFFAALGELDAVRNALDQGGHDLATVNDAFICACRLGHEAVASLLLERSIALDPELGKQVDGSVGRVAFVKYFIETRVAHATTGVGPWKAFVMEQVSRAAHDGDVTAFVSTLQRERWLLAEAYVEFQAGLIGAATLNDRGEIVPALLSLDPALLRRQASPEFHPIALAFTYAKTHLIPLLTRICPMPDDLPHAAGMGDLAQVKRWFDESGAPALGELEKHFPCNDPHTLKYDDLRWGAPTAQHVLDTALAWSVSNRHFDVADFLLEHGANINTDWNSHEPASILHHLVFLPNSYESMRFLIDRGIDMTIKDYRWKSTAQGWARYGANDEKMAQWLEEAERQRATQHI
jgi:Ankyrin repeats (3 copies)